MWKPNILTDIRHQLKSYWWSEKVELNIWDKFIPNKQSWYEWDIINKQDWYYTITDWKNTHLFKI